jgi:hypothetical protein
MYDKKFFMDALKEMYPNRIKENDFDSLIFDDKVNISFNDIIPLKENDKIFKENLLYIIDNKIIVLCYGPSRLVNTVFEFQNYELSFSSIDDNFCLKLFALFKESNNKYHVCLRNKEISAISFIDIIKSDFSFYYLLTIKNKDSVKHNIEDMNRLIRSVIYNMLIYHYNRINPILSAEELLSRKCFIYPLKYINHKKKSERIIEGKLYNSDMLEYFLAASDTSNIRAKYISYYNVVEYAFDGFNLCQQIEFIKNIKEDEISRDKIKIINDLVKANEATKLFNLLNEYLGSEDLFEFLKDNDYYVNNNAHKIKNTKVSIDDQTSYEKNIRIISDRIYKVRNAIVHSKEREEEKYFPADDKYILKEIPLIEYIAMKIINSYGSKH